MTGRVALPSATEDSLFSAIEMDTLLSLLLLLLFLRQEKYFPKRVDSYDTFLKSAC